MSYPTGSPRLDEGAGATTNDTPDTAAAPDTAADGDTATATDGDTATDTAGDGEELEGTVGGLA